MAQQANAMQPLIDSVAESNAMQPLIDGVAEQTRLFETFRLPKIEMVRALPQVATFAGAPHAPYNTWVRDIQRDMTRWSEHQSRTLEQIASVIESARFFVPPPAFSGVYEALAVRHRELLQSDDELGEIDAVEILSEEVQATAATLPLTAQNVRFAFTVLLTLLVFIAQWQSSKNAQREVLGAVEELREVFQDALARPAQESVDESPVGASRALVRRPVTVRSRPNGRQGVALGMLYAGHQVRRLRARGEWVLVEYFDNRLRRQAVGWVLKKRLVRLD